MAADLCVALMSFPLRVKVIVHSVTWGFPRRIVKANSFLVMALPLNFELRPERRDRLA